MDNTVLQGANIRIAGRIIRNPPKKTSEYVSMHSHDADQFYVLLSESSTLKMEIKMDDERQLAESPACIVIPKGTMHSERVVSGKGILISFLMKGSYP